ncbi:MAG: hypothetical protein Q8P53_00325 [Candidatus Shapirobacteria bacterium]|nr:hypothetical protein [Candidatus Shapirobacteria bacterium]
MIFKDRSESAKFLSQKIREEIISSYFLTYIDPDSQKYCQLIANNLNQKLEFLPSLLATRKLKETPRLVILDDGQTDGQEFNEFTDKIRKEHPLINITIAVPVIAQSEQKLFQEACDQLLTLIVEPLFFSVNQFYENQNL